MTEQKKKNSHKEPHEEQPVPEGENHSQDNTSAGEAKPQQTMVALTMEEYDALQKKVEEANSKEKEYLDCWQRERADFMNYKKRIERERELVRANVAADVVLNYLVLQDDLERALKSPPSEAESSAWVEGIEFIYRKLLSMLEKEGIQQIVPEGEMFDPTIHEAVVQEENSDYESGRIIEVISPGYQLGDRIVRPARVRVAR
jgi:molecular chaperone GrpE